MRIVFFIAAAAALAACSSQPPTTEALQSPASVPTAGPATASASADNAVARNEPSAFEPPPGFKLRTVDGQEVYCRKMVVLGSRFPKQLCMTQEQLEDKERGNQAMRDDMMQRNPICGSSVGCGGD